MTQVDWKPFPKEKPKKNDEYLVTIFYSLSRTSITGSAVFSEGRWETEPPLRVGKIIAWAEVPEPYESRENANVTTALAHTAQRFSKNSKMFDLLNEKGIPALPILERAIIDLAIYFEIDDVKEFRKRFYHLFYPEWADFALDCNLVEFPNFMGVKQ